MTTTHRDSVTWNGRTYTAWARDEDRTNFAAPCASYGTRRCAITQPHSTYVHLIIGLAEAAEAAKNLRV